MGCQSVCVSVVVEGKGTVTGLVVGPGVVVGGRRLTWMVMDPGEMELRS